MKFILVTDHKPLLWLHSLKDPIARVARWKILLREYDYEIIHKPGKINMNADALSRNPLPTQPISLSPPLDSKRLFPEGNIERMFLLSKSNTQPREQLPEENEDYESSHTLTE